MRWRETFFFFPDVTVSCSTETKSYLQLHSIVLQAVQHHSVSQESILRTVWTYIINMTGTSYRLRQMIEAKRWYKSYETAEILGNLTHVTRALKTCDIESLFIHECLVYLSYRSLCYRSFEKQVSLNIKKVLTPTNVIFTRVAAGSSSWQVLRSRLATKSVLFDSLVCCTDKHSSFMSNWLICCVVVSHVLITHLYWLTKITSFGGTREAKCWSNFGSQLHGSCTPTTPIMEQQLLWVRLYCTLLRIFDWHSVIVTLCYLSCPVIVDILFCCVRSLSITCLFSSGGRSHVTKEALPWTLYLSFIVWISRYLEEVSVTWEYLKGFFLRTLNQPLLMFVSVMDFYLLELNIFLSSKFRKVYFASFVGVVQHLPKEKMILFILPSLIFPFVWLFSLKLTVSTIMYGRRLHSEQHPSRKRPQPGSCKVFFPVVSLRSLLGSRTWQWMSAFGWQEHEASCSLLQITLSSQLLLCIVLHETFRSSRRG